MSQIFCVTSVNSIGCTFLDWSIHFLSGQNKFYNIISGWDKLSSNPISKENAHGHPKNHPSGYHTTLDVINHLKTVDGELLSLYPTIIHADTALKNLGLDINKVADEQSGVLQSVFEYQKDDYAKLILSCINNNIKTIYVKQNFFPLYNLFIRTLDRKLFEPKPAATTNELREEFLEVFFRPDDKNAWGDIFNNLPIWDQREAIALNIRPFKSYAIDSKVNFSMPHFLIDAMDLWLNGKQKIIEVLDYLGLELNQQRYQSWLSIYDQWREIHLKILNFCWNVDYICESIVSNHYLDLRSYNLDLWQEAIIQHILIYKYNLNLKNWQLTSFPKNTQDLHKLLEANIHSTEILYS